AVHQSRRFTWLGTIPPAVARIRRVPCARPDGAACDLLRGDCTARLAEQAPRDRERLVVRRSADQGDHDPGPRVLSHPKLSRHFRALPRGADYGLCLRDPSGGVRVVASLPVEAVGRVALGRWWPELGGSAVGRARILSRTGEFGLVATGVDSSH